MKTNAETTPNEATTAAVAEQGANAAPEQATSTKKAGSKKGAPKDQKAAKKAATKKEAKPASKKPASKKASKAAGPKPEKGQPREGSKKQIVLDLLRRKGGATMVEIAKATGWQNHSIRGFVSGTLMKKMDLPVASFKNAAGERCYRIEK